MASRFEMEDFQEALDSMGAELIPPRLDPIQIREAQNVPDFSKLLHGIVIPPPRISKIWKHGVKKNYSATREIRLFFT